jgi:putative aldouronate transport system substrate-binding protein
VKRWRKPFTMFAAAGTAAALLLSACSNTPSKESGSPAGEAEKPEITVMAFDYGNVPQDEGTMEKNRWVDWINQNAPVRVKFVSIPRTESAQKLNILFASGTAPDLIIDYDKNLLNSLYTQNQLLALDDLIKKDSPYYESVLQKYPTLAKLGKQNDGKIYKIGKVNGTDVNVSMYIRADWLKKLNLSMPTTPEELLNVAKAFAEQDPDGNGKKDTYGVALSSFGGLIDYMFQNVDWVLDNGELTHDWQRAKAAADYKKKLFDAGVTDKDYLVDTNGKKAEQDWMKGKLGIWSATIRLATFQDFKKNNPDAEVAILPMPGTQFGHFSPEATSPFAVNGVINRNAKNPDAVMKYLDWLLNPDNSTTLKYGLEGVHWKKGPSGCPTPIDKDKSAKEVGYTQGYWVLHSKFAEGKCGTVVGPLDTSDPVQKDFLELYNAAKKEYVTPERPMPYLIDSNNFPALSPDLLTIQTNAMKAVQDLWNKAIVSGGAYTTEQSLKDAQELWKKSGGDKVDEWMKKYYADNKQNIVTTKEWYNTVVDSK